MLWCKSQLNISLDHQLNLDSPLENKFGVNYCNPKQLYSDRILIDKRTSVLFDVCFVTATKNDRNFRFYSSIRLRSAASAECQQL